MLTDPRSPFFQLAADLSRKAHAAAMSSPDFSSESAPPMTPERAAEVEIMYARAEAAAAIVKMALQWRQEPYLTYHLEQVIDRYNALSR